MTDTHDVSILIVEDDDIDYKVLQRAFKSLRVVNHQSRALDGLEALEILRGENGHDKFPRPTLVLLDINMPRMNGLEFLRELRKDPDLKKTVVFILTTSRDEGDIDEAYDLNVAGYIYKGDAERNFNEAVKMIGAYWRLVELPA